MEDKKVKKKRDRNNKKMKKVKNKKQKTMYYDDDNKNEYEGEELMKKMDRIRTHMINQLTEEEEEMLNTNTTETHIEDYFQNNNQFDELCEDNGSKSQVFQQRQDNNNAGEIITCDDFLSGEGGNGVMVDYNNIGMSFGFDSLPNNLQKKSSKKKERRLINRFSKPNDIYVTAKDETFKRPDMHRCKVCYWSLSGKLAQNSQKLHEKTQRMEKDGNHYVDDFDDTTSAGMILLSTIKAKYDELYSSSYASKLETCAAIAKIWNNRIKRERKKISDNTFVNDDHDNRDSIDYFFEKISSEITIGKTKKKSSYNHLIKFSNPEKRVLRKRDEKNRFSMKDIESSSSSSDENDSEEDYDIIQRNEMNKRFEEEDCDNEKYKHLPPLIDVDDLVWHFDKCLNNEDENMVSQKLDTLSGHIDFISDNLVYYTGRKTEQDIPTTNMKNGVEKSMKKINFESYNAYLSGLKMFKELVSVKRQVRIDNRQSMIFNNLSLLKEKIPQLSIESAVSTLKYSNNFNRSSSKNTSQFKGGSTQGV